MTSPIDQVINRILGTYRSWNRSTTVERMRADWDAMFPAEAVPHRLTPVMAGGVPAAWIDAEAPEDAGVILYFHGGGFRMGSIASHRDLMARLAAASGCRVLGLDYRLAPEHAFPAPLEDALTAFRWLLSQGHGAQRIVVAGDSAGGGLALSTMLALRTAGEPLPAAGLLLSPWTDLAATGASYETRSAADPIHQRPMILALARGYLGAADTRDPRASPLYGELHGLPPLLIQVGDRETVLDDATMFAGRAGAAGVTVELQVFDGMIHVFQQFAADLPEAREAIDDLGAFARSHLTAGVPPMAAAAVHSSSCTAPDTTAAGDRP